MFENITDFFRNKSLPPEWRQSMEAFLSKMGASTRKTVAVSVSQNVGIEMVEIDNIAGVITKYAVKELAYDVQNRRIENYNKFAEAINELFSEFEISSNSNIVLSLPNIYFGLVEVPAILRGDSVKNVILSEIEQSYIFKSNEPLVSWHNLTKRKKEKDKPNIILCSAIQKDVIDGILDACQNIGCTFLTIENSNLSVLRGLSFLGYTREQIKENSIWQLLIIDASSFSLFTMQGASPTSYVEEPLAMKSFEEGEVYGAIASSVNDIINNRKTKSTGLILISQTDYVSAEFLKNELETYQPIEILECNKYSSQVLYPTVYEIPPEEAEKISLTSIGTASFIFHNYPISLNYIKENIEELQQLDDQIGNIKVNLGNIELSITKDTIRRLSLIFGLVMLVPLILIYLLVGQIFLPSEKDKSGKLAANIESIKKQIEDMKKADNITHFDINTAAKRNVTQNKILLFQYSVLGEITPKNLWINHVEERNNDLLISGVAMSTHVVYDFYKNLKVIMNNPKLILTKLQFSNEDLDDYIVSHGKVPATMYSFEIVSSKDLIKSFDIRRNFNLSTVEDKISEDKGSGRITTSAEPPPKNQPQAQNDSPKQESQADDKNKKAPNGNADNKNKPKNTQSKDSGKDGELPPNLKKIENLGS